MMSVVNAHGVVSQYSDICKPTVHAGVLSDGMIPGDDSIPYEHTLQPAPLIPECVTEDAALCITPEHRIKTKGKSQRKSVNSGITNATDDANSNHMQDGCGSTTYTGSRRDLKVTFDRTVDVCNMSPEMLKCSDESSDNIMDDSRATGEAVADESIDIVDINGVSGDLSNLSLTSNDSGLGVSKTYNYRVYCDESDDDMAGVQPLPSTEDKTSSECKSTEVQDSIGATSTLELEDQNAEYTLCDTDTDVYCKQHDQRRLQQNSSGATAPVCHKKSNIIARTNYTGIDTEHALARPEFNSTLKVSNEAEKLRKSELNVDKAVKAKLQQSEGTRNRISEKATSKLNTQTTHTSYDGLISVDVHEDEVVGHAEKKLAASAPKSTSTKSKHADVKFHHVPDLLDFYDAKFEKELASTKQFQTKRVKPALRSVGQQDCFTIYRHRRVWEGWND